MLKTIFTGAMLSGELIIAIGSQNMFVLRQGLLKNNVFAVVFIYFACDLLLMMLGVMGLSKIVTSLKSVIFFLSLGGAVFLYYYGLNSLKRAYLGESHIKIDITDKDSKNIERNHSCSISNNTFKSPRISRYSSYRRRSCGNT